MKADNRDAIDFANEPVGALFRRMLVPTLIGMVSVVLLNFTDGAFVGHGVGAEALAAVNIAAPIFNIMHGIGIMFGTGCAVVASIHLSRGKEKAANINVTQAILGSEFIAILVSVLILTHLPETCKLFGSNDTLVPMASSYLKWIAISQPFIILEIMGLFIVRMDGSPKFAMMCSSTASLLNIILDWLFIYPMKMGLEGAAIATSLSFSLAGLAVFIYFVGFSQKIHLYKLRMTVKSFHLTMRNLGYQIRMGTSAMLGEISVSGSVVVGNYMFIHYLGEDGVAAYSVACYCFPFIFMMAYAIVQSAQPIVSYAYGLENETRLNESYRMMIRWAITTGVLLSMLMCFCAPYITMLFIDAQEQAYDICIEGLPYFSFGILFATLNIVLIGYYQSVEQSRKATVYTLLRGFVFVIPCFVILPILYGSIGLWIAIPLSELITFITILTPRIVRRAINKSMPR